MNFCQKCNLEYDASFCPNCGTTQSAPLNNNSNIIIQPKNKIYSPKPTAGIQSIITSDTTCLPKKQMNKQWVLLALLPVVLIICFYFLLNSTIPVKEQSMKASGSFFIRSLINGLSETDDSFEMILSYSDLNPFLAERIDLTEVSVLGYQPQSIHYDNHLKNFILPLNSAFGKSTLTLDVNASFENEKLLFQLENPRLGKYQLPLPQFLFPSKKLQWELATKEIPFLSIQNAFRKMDGIHITGALNKDYFNQEFSKIVESIRPTFADYLQNHSGKTVPAFDNFISYQSGTVISPILKKIYADSTNRINWYYILPKKATQRYIRTILPLLTKEEFRVLTDISQPILDELPQVMEKYQSYIQNELKSTLLQISDEVFSAIYEMHANSGVPNYYLASKGKLYSQTLREYITLDSLNLRNNDLSYCELFAKGTSAILGIRLNDDFWYVLEDNPYEVIKENYFDFLTSIHFSADESPDATLVLRGDANRSAIATLVSQDLQCDDSIFIPYLAVAEEDAFLVAAPDYDTQTLIQYLLKKSGNAWSILRKITSEEGVLHYLLQEEIQNQTFNVRILPPYEINDFQRAYFTKSDLNQLSLLMYYSNEFYSDLPEIIDKPINYFSSVNDNIYITYDAEHRYLLNEQNVLRVSKGVPIKNYLFYLQPHPQYFNYYPEFIFYQD